MTAPTRFNHGVGSFDPHADGVLLWTLVDGGGPVSWIVGIDPELRQVVASGGAIAEPEPGAVTVEVTGLQPAMTYWYRFETEEDRSPIGRTRTLPAPGEAVDRLRIGVTCCARYTQATFEVYRALADSDVDLVLYVGDYMYEDCKDGVKGREADPPHDCITLADYRTRMAQYRADPHLQALHAAHSMVVVWDDHDFSDNASRDEAPNHDPAKQGPWADRVAAAVQAQHEFLPKRLADPGDLTSVWRTFDAGGLLRLVCTETRVTGRDPQARAEDDALPVDHPDRSLFGDLQRQWLLPQLADPDPTWLVLANGTVASELVVPAPAALDHVLPEKYEVVDGQAINTDQWDGYRAEREKVTAAFEQRDGGRGCVVVSGDIHSAWAIEGPRGHADSPVAVEFVCPPAATTPLGRLLPPGVGAALGPALRHHLAHVRWVDVDQHGYIVVEVTPERLVAAFWMVEPAEGARAELASAWAVQASEPGRLHPVAPAPPGHEQEASDEAPPSPLAHIERRRRIRRLAAIGLTGVATAAWCRRRWSR